MYSTFEQYLLFEISYNAIHLVYRAVSDHNSVHDLESHLLGFTCLRALLSEIGYIWFEWMLLFTVPVWHHNLHFTIASVLSIEKVRLLFYVTEGHTHILPIQFMNLSTFSAYIFRVRQILHHVAYSLVHIITAISCAWRFRLPFINTWYSHISNYNLQLCRIAICRYLFFIHIFWKVLTKISWEG